MRKQLLAGAMAVALATTMTTNAMAFDHGGGFHGGGSGFHGGSFSSLHGGSLNGVSGSYPIMRGSTFAGVRGLSEYRANRGWGGQRIALPR